MATLNKERLLEEMKASIDLWEKTRAVFAGGTSAAQRELYANTEGYFEAVQDTIDEIQSGNYDA